MVIAIDFDGTCVTHEFPDIGKSIGAEKVLKKLIDNGHQLILFTMRSDSFLKEAVDWFQKHNIQLYGINTNPTQKSWTNSPKASAEIYIDDAALGCPLKFDSKSDRAYVDWKQVEIMLKKMHIIN